MNIQEIIKKEVGSKVYHIHNGDIRKWILMGFHPKNDMYYYFISDSDCSTTKCVYLGTDGVGNWVDNYDDAKELMWLDIWGKVRSINDIYFGGSKELDFSFDIK